MWIGNPLGVFLVLILCAISIILSVFTGGKR